MDSSEDKMIIRKANVEDLKQIVDIFNFYVVNGHISFGTELNTVDNRRAWMESFGEGRYRLLVAERAGEIIGCTYSSRYRPTPPFDYTVETSIYLHPEKRRNGTGSKLYSALFELLSTEPIHVALAGIANPNPGSIALHRKFGFQEVGTFSEYARKHDNWISSTWFQKPMNRGDDAARVVAG